MSEMVLCDIHQQQTNMDKETQIQQVVDNVVIKNEEADECMLVVGEQTLLKQHTLDRDCLETCHNVYDSYFEVLNHELCDNNSEIKTFTDNQQESPQAAVNLSTEFAPTLGKPLTMMWTDETSSMGEVCFESKTQQSLQKAKDTDDRGLVCGAVNSRATPTHNKLFTCEHCDLQFYCSITLKVHMRIHSEEKPFTCNVCSYKCAAYSILMNHMSAHTAKKLFSCKHCDFKCTQSTHLKVHLTSHTEEKRFTCNICNYKCEPKRSFMRHMQTHKEKPYSCKQCDVKCARADTLKGHMRTHTGEKPFTCKFCGFKCSLSFNLKVHMRTHTGEKPYCCKHCDLKFSHSSNFQVHMRKTHEDSH